MNKLNESDRVLLAEATDRTKEANATFQFVLQFLVKVYQLPEGAIINPDNGEIILPGENDVRKSE